MLRQQGFDAPDDHLHGHVVVPALGDDDVGVRLRGLHEFHVHGADGALILLHHRLHGASAFIDVSQQTADKADVRGRVHIELDVHHIPQTLVRKDQDALHQDHGAGQHAAHLLAADVPRKVVDGRVHRLTLHQQIDVFDEQVVVEGVGMVVVQVDSFFPGQMRGVFVIGVVGQIRDAIPPTRSRMRCTTVVLPEPLPPAMPTTMGFSRRSLGSVIKSSPGRGIVDGR